jgi:hypothetical protein
MRKLLAVLFGLWLSIFPLAALAASANVLAGTWLAAAVNSSGTRLSFELKLYENGRFKDSVFIVNSGGGRIVEGTYTVSGNNLTLKGTARTYEGGLRESPYELSETFTLNGNTLILPREKVIVTYTRNADAGVK